MIWSRALIVDLPLPCLSQPLVSEPSSGFFCHSQTHLPFKARHGRGGGLGGEESGTQPCAAGLADRNCKVLGCILDAASLELSLLTPLVLCSFGVYPSVMGRWIHGGVIRYTAQHRSPAVGHPPLGYPCALGLWRGSVGSWVAGPPGGGVLGD